MNPYIRCILPLDFDANKLPVPEHWPYESILELMKRLTYRMQIICAVTAIELSLPIWKEFRDDDAYAAYAVEAAAKAAEKASTTYNLFCFDWLNNCKPLLTEEYKYWINWLGGEA